MMAKELAERLLPLLDMLDEGIQCGARVFAGSEGPALRNRIAAAVLGGAADENADDVAVLQRNAALVREALLHMLEESGVAPFDAVGETYARERHEALEHRDAGPEYVGRVIEQLRPGYTLQGEVIRRAQIVLGRPKMQASDSVNNS